MENLENTEENTSEVKFINPIGMDSWRMEVDYTNEPVNQAVTVKEVIEAMKTMKNNKAVGQGGMLMELIRNPPIVTLEPIARLFTSCLQGSVVPEEWKIAYTQERQQMKIRKL
ncbi:hypothetical protein Trydic_g12204 [Trypoxylus dichotomus]